MAIFEWSDNKYALGFPEIDSQHRGLFDIINELHDSMLAGKAKDAVGGIFRRLSSYVETHFTAEERMLQLRGYSQLSQHKEMHKTYVAKLNQFMADYQAGSMTLSIELLNFLRDWLSKHILVADRAYQHELSSRG